jgi:ATP-binding cassette subfamily B protein
MLRQIVISLPISTLTDLMLMTAMLFVMSLMDLQLTLIALMVAPLLFLLIKKYRKPMRAAMKEQREKEGTLSSHATEILGAIRLVQGYQQEEEEIKKFSTQNVTTLKSGLKASRIEAKLKWASELSVAMITALILFISGKQVMQGALSPGDLLVFIFYLKMFNRPLRRLSKYMEQMARGTAAGERILELLEVENEVFDLPGCKNEGQLRGEITFKDVSFSYRASKQTLQQITLTIEAGEKVAIIGKSGSGKSTLVSLIPRFWDPTSGKVLIDGEDVKNYSLKLLRKQIAIVFQEPILFAATVAENIAYGKPGATLEEIQEAAKKIGIDEMILSLEEGYQTHVGERGVTLSGGQRQCIAICRAMIRNCSILILDEPTSGLDRQSAQMVMNALVPLMENKTCILITHHKEILPGIERIITLKKGTLWTKFSEEQSMQPV